MVTKDNRCIFLVNGSLLVLDKQSSSLVKIKLHHDLYDTTRQLNAHYKIHPTALLSIPCEHHFATMRSRYQMPTLLQYCDLLASVIDETLRRTTVSAYIYYTSKKSYYLRPTYHIKKNVRYHQPTVTSQLP